MFSSQMGRGPTARGAPEVGRPGEMPSSGAVSRGGVGSHLRVQLPRRPAPGSWVRFVKVAVSQGLGRGGLGRRFLECYTESILSAMPQVR